MRSIAQLRDNNGVASEWEHTVGTYHLDKDTIHHCVLQMVAGQD